MSGTTRELLPIVGKKLALRALDVSYGLYGSLLTRFHIVDYTVPPYSLMRHTSGSSLRHYFHSGMNCFLPLVTCARSAKVRLDEPIKILDFGCGAGRQLLHFTRHFPHVDYFACDVVDDNIRFIQRAYPQVQAYANAYRPALQYPSEFFDMIYSVSIFSHLPPPDHREWLAELARVSKRGAHLFLTIEGPLALRILGTSGWGVSSDRVEGVFEERGLLYREYPDLAVQKAHEDVMRQGSKYIGIDGSYGSTVMSRSYVMEHWASDSLEVVDVIDGVIDNRQDIVVLRRL
jgi:SAM-dependent methyltransferase